MPLYDVSEYERHQWRYQQMTHKAHSHVVNSGERRYEGFDGFSSEVFHKFVAPEPKPIEEPNPGQEIFQRLHTAMDEIPEVQDLRERCEHDEDWSAQATNTILQSLLDETDDLGEQVPSSESDMESLRAMEQMLNRMEEDETSEATLEKVKDEMEGLLHQAAEHAINAEQIANNMDATNIRSAIRKGVSDANDAIDAEITAQDAFPGDQAHSGKRARREVSARIAGVLKDNKRLAEIIKLAGRLRRIALDEQRKKPKRGVDEYCGIEPGAALERLVPSEWAMLDDPDLEPLFLRRMTERSLAQFEITARKKEQQGPIVFLLDSSGSMNYYKCDAWAAAVAMAFMQIAINQKRAFAIVHFGGHVIRVDKFSKDDRVDPAKIAEAVSFFASAGGTNFIAPLDRAIEIIREDGAFKKADIVMCTDGEASINPSWLKYHKEGKAELEFSTFSIMVGPDVSSSINAQFSDEVVHLEKMLDGDEAMHKFFRAV